MCSSFVSLVSLLLGFVVVSAFCFFFKQNTAYEMRISDWSSDVCSSDLIIDREVQSDAAIPELGFDADLVAVRIFGQHLVQSWTRGRSAIEGAGFVPLRVGSVHQNIPEGLGLEADLRRPLRV